MGRRRIKVTDLEDFALRQLVRPYQSDLGFPYEKGVVVRLPFSLDELADMVEADTEWSRMVRDRVQKYGIYFPSYIKHRLVDILQQGG